jgi:type IV fimbrial biogenesis protein FimT
MAHNLQRTRGFTFIELVVALAIIAVITAWGFPEYQQFKRNQLMTLSVNQFSAAIMFARSQSIIRTEHIIICPIDEQHNCRSDGQWHRGWMVFADLDRDRIYNHEDVILLTEAPLSEGVTALSSRFRSKLRFNQTGFAPGTNVTVRFCDPRGARFGKAIIISNVGRPRLAQSIDRCE